MQDMATEPARHRITVLMPVYNGEAFLGEAIESVLAQTCRDFQLIVRTTASFDFKGRYTLLILFYRS